MGEVVMHRRSALGQLLIASAAAAAAIVAGCTASRPAKVVQAQPAGHSTASADARSSATTTKPTEIRALEIREGAPEVYVDLKASAAPVWTSYRNAQGQVVIELPNTVAAASVTDLSPGEGLISSLKVQRETDGNRPLTRLVVETRQEVEHTVTAENLDLHVRLAPVDGDKRAALSPSMAPSPATVEKVEKVEPEPIPPPPPVPATAPAASSASSASAPAPAAPAAEPTPATPATPAIAERSAPSAAPSTVSAGPAGTPEQPAVAPAPRGASATRLNAIEVSSSGGSGGGAVIRIAGDGEFPYQTFALGDPARFVIDLSGVMNHSSRSTVAVDHGLVQRVRVAQFKPMPQPVARVVFDLRHGTVPHIERTAQALVVTFAGADNGAASGSSGGSSATMSSPAPEPAVSAAASAPAPEPAPMPSTSTSSTSPTSSKAAKSDPSQGTEIAATSSTEPPPPPAPSRTSKKSRKNRSAAATTATASTLPAVSPGSASDLTPSGVAPASTVASVSTPNIKAVSSTHRNDGLNPPAPAGTVLASTATGSGKQQPSDLQLNRAPGAAMGGTASPAESFASQTVGQQGERTYVGEPIDLKVTNADVTDVLRTFAQLSGLNIVVQPGVTGTVTAEMENVPWDQALEQVLKINKLGYELEGNVMRIAPTSILRDEAKERQELSAARALAVPLRTIMKPLSYARAQDIAQLLKTGEAGLLSQRGSVIVDTRTNTLIIKELPNYLDTVIAVIEQLDTPEPQVMIEARIIETTKNYDRNVGIKWSFNGVADAAHGNTTGLVFPNNGTVTGNVDVSGSSGNLLGIHLGNVLNTFTLDAALQAAEDEGLVHILSAPKVATLNNQRASIQSGLQIPIQTIANNTVTVQFVNATLRLDVTPQVTAEGTILMDIDISKREPLTAFLVPGATNAPISTKDAHTRLVVRDGGTAVIGGIYKVTNNDAQSRIPGLANIPILGNLFKNRSRSDSNDELLIFITPRVIKL
jgi:type IV pilus assembly protein PilQ